MAGVPGIIAIQIMGGNTSSGGPALHSALTSPARAITEQYLSHKNAPSLQDIPATEVALILRYFQVFLQ